MALEYELAVYRAQLHDLLENEGKFVLIRGDEVSGPYDGYEDATREGYRRYGITPFLAKKIQRAEPIHYFSRDLR